MAASAPKTDIYAIGGVIHWYLFGASPNEGSGVAEILMETIDRQRSNDDTGSETIANFQTIMRRSLVPSPADRSISIQELVCELSKHTRKDGYGKARERIRRLGPVAVMASGGMKKIE